MVEVEEGEVENRRRPGDMEEGSGGEVEGGNKWQGMEEMSRTMCDTKALRTLSFYQYVDFPTRLKAKLDLCFCNVKDAFVSEKKHPLQSVQGQNSDHCVIVATPMYIPKSAREKVVKTLRLRTENASDIISDVLQSTDWETLMPESENLDSWVETFTGYLQHLIALPDVTFEKQVRIRSTKQWFNKQCYDIKRARDKAYKAGQDETCKALCQRLVEACRAAKLQYFEKVADKMGSSSAGFKVIKDLTCEESGQSLKTDGVDELKGKSKNEIANILNDFYNRFSDGNSLGSRYLDYEVFPELSVLELPEWYILALLKSLNSRKASGPDGIPCWVLKECRNELVVPIKMMFDRSYREGYVPLKWKSGTIKPIPKVKHCTKLKDFRPITKTSILGKLLQKPTKQVLQSHTIVLSDPLQFGFTAGKSSVDALVYLWDFVVKNLEQTSTAVFVFLMDFSSAFDSVSHEAVWNAMTEMKIPRWLARWFVSFLQDREQSVEIDGILSKASKVSAGVPQGEVDSPPLFNIVTNPIAVLTILSKLVKFADDNSLVHVIQCEEDYESYCLLAEEIFAKSAERGLKLNPEKCKELRFDFTKKARFSEKLPPLIIENTPIECVDSAKLLGANLSSDCGWSDHIDTLVTKCNIQIRNLYRLRKSGLPDSVCQKYAESYIYPSAVYGAPLFFDSLTKGDLERMTKIDKRISTAVNYKPARFSERCEKICARQFQKMCNRNDVLIPASRGSGKGRRAGDIKVPFARTERYKRTFIPHSLGRRQPNSVVYKT